MAKIQNVDYERIPGQATQMRSEGQVLNTELKSAYESINLMRNFWYGKRYDSLVKEFNEIKSSINLSIVIPVYNSEKYLNKCLNSIINQTLNEIEIICIDDCSTDNL